MKQKIINALVLVAVVAVLYVFGAPSYRQVEPSLSGTRPRDFAMELDGRATRLSDFRGKVVVLNFWASWCPPCLEETPSLNKLQEEIAPRGGVVLGISMDDDEGAYKRFLEDQHVVFPTYRDASKKLAPDYGTAMYPETYLIDREDKIARKIIGPQNWQSPEIMKSINTLLDQK